MERDRAGINPARGLAAKNSDEPRAPSTQEETNHEAVSDRAEEAMEEDDTNPILDVKECLPASFSMHPGLSRKMSVKHLLTSQFWQETL